MPNDGHPRHGRKQPYTKIGVGRLPCTRCGRPARYQWQICADGNLHRPICEVCDIELNEAVLRFMGFPEDWVQAKIKTYRERVDHDLVPR